MSWFLLGQVETPTEKSWCGPRGIYYKREGGNGEWWGSWLRQRMVVNLGAHGNQRIVLRFSARVTERLQQSYHEERPDRLLPTTVAEQMVWRRWVTTRWWAWGIAGLCNQPVISSRRDRKGCATWTRETRDTRTRKKQSWLPPYSVFAQIFNFTRL